MADLCFRGCALLATAALIVRAGDDAGTVGDYAGMSLDQLLNIPVTVSSKREERLQDAPLDVTVLTGEELQAMGYVTLADALGGVLGYRTNEDRTYQLIGVRGVEVPGDYNTRILILLDGHALNSAGGVYHAKTGEDFGLPLSRVARIEVVRGPAGSLYGSNAFQGMVNVVTRDAEAKSGDGGRLAVADSSERALSAWGHAQTELGPVHLSLSATGLRARGSSFSFPELEGSPGYTGRIPEAADRERATGVYFRAQGKSGVPWSFAGLVMHRDKSLPAAPYRTEIGLSENRFHNDQEFEELRIDPAFGNLELSARVWHERSRFHAYYVYRGIRDGSGYALDAFDDYPDRADGAELRAQYRFSDRARGVAGVEYQSHRLVGQSAYVDGSYGTPVDKRYRLVNFYLQGEWQPIERLRFVAGLQHASHSLFDSSTAVRLVTLWTADERDRFKLIFGTGFRNPTIVEAYYASAGSYAANPDLQPERTRNAQWVWLRSWNGVWQSQVGATVYDWDRLIFTGADPLGQVQSQNSPVRRKGSAWEFELQRRSRRFWLTADAGLYRLRADGVDADNLSRTQAGLKAIWWLRGSLSAAAEARYVGRREIARPGLASVAAPGKWTTRASVRWNQPSYWLQLTGEDLADARREDLPLLRDYNPVTRIPGAGRTVRLELGAAF